MIYFIVKTEQNIYKRVENILPAQVNLITYEEVLRWKAMDKNIGINEQFLWQEYWESNNIELNSIVQNHWILICLLADKLVLLFLPWVTLLFQQFIQKL